MFHVVCRKVIKYPVSFLIKLSFVYSLLFLDGPEEVKRLKEVREGTEIMLWMNGNFTTPIIIVLLFFSWYETESTWYCGHCFGLLCQPQMIDDDDDDDCGAIGGMRISRGNRSTRRNLPQCHFVHHMT
jgi:hypothetical protein